MQPQAQPELGPTLRPQAQSELSPTLQPQVQPELLQPPAQTELSPMLQPPTQPGLAQHLVTDSGVFTDFALRKVFNSYGPDSNGLVNITEVTAQLARTSGKNIVEAFRDEADSDDDGKISYEEFARVARDMNIPFDHCWILFDL